MLTYQFHNLLKTYVYIHIIDKSSTNNACGMELHVPILIRSVFNGKKYPGPMDEKENPRLGTIRATGLQWECRIYTNYVIHQLIASLSRQKPILWSQSSDKTDYEVRKTVVVYGKMNSIIITCPMITIGQPRIGSSCCKTTNQFVLSKGTHNYFDKCLKLLSN